ncbi:MAG: HAD family phosphatase [Hyphomicrobiales bacterium]|nr:HAD family phosphatase [Hyphomicrobiales bacterium]
MSKIDTVIFDVGNVLLDWNPRHLYRKLFDDEERMEWFLANICTPAWNLEQDRGRSFPEAVRELILLHPEWEREIRAFDERWHEMIPGEIAGSIELLSTLKQRGIRLFALTNFSREKYEETFARFPFLREFEGVIVSGQERLLKPDAAIFRLLLERYACEASRCLFIDDSARNVEGARRIGMQALLFTGAADLERDLERLGLLPAP